MKNSLKNHLNIQKSEKIIKIHLNNRRIFQDFSVIFQDL